MRKVLLLLILFAPLSRMYVLEGMKGRGEAVYDVTKGKNIPRIGDRLQTGVCSSLFLLDTPAGLCSSVKSCRQNCRSARGSWRMSPEQRESGGQT